VAHANRVIASIPDASGSDVTIPPIERRFLSEQGTETNEYNGVPRIAGSGWSDRYPLSVGQRTVTFVMSIRVEESFST
jgi:hypothetical protein